MGAYRLSRPVGLLAIVASAAAGEYGAPVRSIDGRALPVRGPLTARLAYLYAALIDTA